MAKKTGLHLEERNWISFSRGALRRNYLQIASLVPGQWLCPMVKANAYGCGLEYAVRSTQGLPALYGYGVATIEEGLQTRRLLRSHQKPILVFYETDPWAEWKTAAFKQGHLTAVLGSIESLRLFLKKSKGIPWHLNVNTGMNRLGFRLQDLKEVERLLRRLPHRAPEGMCSHFACGEDPLSPTTQRQIREMREVAQWARSLFPHVTLHLGNSAGIWNEKRLGFSEFTQMVRPGLALYGIPPWEKARGVDLEPVFRWSARVVGVHRLRQGEQVGYGGTYVIVQKGSVFAAIVGCGYGDGLMRNLSNRGLVGLSGKVVPMIGAVGMDLVAIRATSQTRPGDIVNMLGGPVAPWLQARLANTIPYELLTSIQPRVTRTYIDEFDA
jgi:alanine racemase